MRSPAERGHPQAERASPRRRVGQLCQRPVRTSQSEPEQPPRRAQETRQPTAIYSRHTMHRVRSCLGRSLVIPKIRKTQAFWRGRLRPGLGRPIVARLRRAEAACMEARREVRPSIGGALGGSGWTTVQRKCSAKPTTSSSAFCRQRRLLERVASRVEPSIARLRGENYVPRGFAIGCGSVQRSWRGGSRQQRKRPRRLFGQRQGRQGPALGEDSKRFSARKGGHPDECRKG
jgi:hypothetical protein